MTANDNSEAGEYDSNTNNNNNSNNSHQNDDECAKLNINNPSTDHPIELHDSPNQVLPVSNEMDSQTAGSEVGCVQGCRQTAHLKTWAMSLLMLLLFIIMVAASLVTGNVELGWWFPLQAVVYICYLVECCRSSSSKYLCNMGDIEVLEEYVARVHGSRPSLWWRAVCYHYETRHRVVHYTDANGYSQTRTETYQETVVTHTALEYYPFSSWKDISLPIATLNLSDFRLTKMTFLKTSAFSNAQTSTDYASKKSQFERANRFDTYQTYTSGVEIDSYKEKMLTVVEGNTAPRLLSAPAFWCASICYCSACYRMWFSSIVGRKKYTFVKEVAI